MFSKKIFIGKKKFIIFLRKKKEDAVEKFERMQREMMSQDPESLPYHTARIRTEKKVFILLKIKF